MFRPSQDLQSMIVTVLDVLDHASAVVVPQTIETDQKSHAHFEQECIPRPHTALRASCQSGSISDTNTQHIHLFLI